MEYRHSWSIIWLLLVAGCSLLASVVHAFVVPPSCPHDGGSARSCRSKHQHQRPSDVAALSVGWSAQEKAELLRGLVDWQERDVDGIGMAGIKILTESSPTAVLTRYYESLAAGEAQDVVLVAPSCSIESHHAEALEESLSSEFISRVYHPDVEQGPGGKAPHLALWHEEVSADVFSPSSVLEQQTASLPQKAVMEEVFLWLQRTMLGMVDDEEESFVELGRKLLTVHKYVVVNATTEAELSRTFWQEATALVEHGVAAAAEKDKKDAEEAAKREAERAATMAKTEAEEVVGKAEGEAAESGETAENAGGSGKGAEQAGTAAEEDVLKASGLGGGDNPKEDSVLLALPGFRFKDRPTFEEFVKVKLAQPLKALSPLGVGGVELSADVYAGEDLKFPVILMSPFLEKFEAPEGGYKFINGRGEEQDADEYIRVQELKLAEEANERIKQQEQNPLFGPRSSSPPAGGDDGDVS